MTSLLSLLGLLMTQLSDQAILMTHVEMSLCSCTLARLDVDRQS